MRRTPLYAAAIFVGAFSAFPLLWVLITSLKQRGEIFTETPDLWPNDPAVRPLREVLLDSGVGRALLNSLLVAGVSTLLGVAVAALAGYAVARSPSRCDARSWWRSSHADVPARRADHPAVHRHAPERPARQLRRADRRLPGLHGSARDLDLRGFIETIPVELEEAALVDGATRLQARWRGSCCRWRCRASPSARPSRSSTPGTSSCSR